jgi:D-beta-D-heptose 7-phosphate kinase/D-beta-D-heptose 1-phosphate adenosyltransferase
MVKRMKWNREKLLGYLEAIAGRKILVVGDVGVDRYTIGSVERISPEAPVPIVLVQEERLKLGLAANVADNVQALGGVPLLTGVVGRDRTADDFRGLLRRAKIGANHLVVDAARRTVLKERIVSERQQLLRVDYETPGEMPARTSGRLLAKVRELIAECDAVIVEDYAKGLLTPKLASAIFAEARKARKLVAVDPNRKSPLELYVGASVLTPNTREAEKLSGIAIRDEASLVLAGRRLLSKTRARYVVITRGKDGMAIFQRGQATVRIIPTYAREVYDVSGAGDTVIAVLTLALAAGATIEDAAVLGNLAAGVEVGKRGTATVTPEEVRVAMEFFEAVGV